MWELEAKVSLFQDSSASICSAEVDSTITFQDYFMLHFHQNTFNFLKHQFQKICKVAP